jgi:YesN/AraC family two-component response regulator
MRIMIVEDEPLVRIGMKSIVPWENHGYKIVGEASDGREAISVAAQCRPDIILVDIVLPEMNGLEFISEIKSVLTATKFIILSNWEDLKYYRRAISLGVSEYIVKSSVQPQEIVSIVDKVSREIKKQRLFGESEDETHYYRQDIIILNELLNQILEKEITDEAFIKEKLSLFNLRFDDSFLYLLVLQTNETGENDTSEDDLRAGSLLEVCNEIISDVHSGVMFRSYEGLYIALVGLPRNEKVKELLEYLSARLHETIFQLFDHHIAIGVSDRLMSLSHIRTGYEQGKKALDRLFFEGFGKTFYHQRKIVEKMSTYSEIDRCFSSIVSSSYLWDIPETIKTVYTLASLVAEEKTMTKRKAKEYFAGILYHFRELARAASLGEEISGAFSSPYDAVESSRNMEQLTETAVSYLDHIKSLLDSRYADSAGRLVNGVNQYVDEHYSEKITLESIAGSIHFSPSYISRVYKQETGITVHERIMQVKIEKSKELLLQNRTLASIAETLNFSSESYFIKVFKEYAGRTPGQFVKKLS